MFSLQLTVNEKSQNLRRLQAQRNELNAKGMVSYLLIQKKQPNVIYLSKY